MEEQPSHKRKRDVEDQGPSIAGADQKKAGPVIVVPPSEGGAPPNKKPSLRGTIEGVIKNPISAYSDVEEVVDRLRELIGVMNDLTEGCPTLKAVALSLIGPEDPTLMEASGFDKWLYDLLQNDSMKFMRMLHQWGVHGKLLDTILGNHEIRKSTLQHPDHSNSQLISHLTTIIRGFCECFCRLMDLGWEPKPNL